MQSPTSTYFTCLLTDIITIIATNSGRVWRSLTHVNHECSGIPLQAPTTSTDFTCLPPDIITTIATNSGRVWRSLARVNHIYSVTLSWKEFVQRFTTAGVVTKLRFTGQFETVVDILDSGRTWVKLLDGVPHSEEGDYTWIVEAGTRYSTNFSTGDVPAFGVELAGVYRRGILVRGTGPSRFTPIASIEWMPVS
jgi:hypothetical protein